MPVAARVIRMAALVAARLRGAIKRYQARRTLEELLRRDERLLRDIGMSRGEIIACLSLSGDEATDFFEVRRAAKNRASIAASVRPERLAA